ncbi:MAG TPA: aminoglycoside phosphotransferase family protein [Chloroflexota bacterium]
MPLLEVRSLLVARFGGVTDLVALRGGEISQAFAFCAAGQDYIVRFNRSSAGFTHDQYAWQHYASPALPIPRVLEIGQTGELHYCISERVPGTDLWSLPEAEHRRLLSLALDTLDDIHAIDVHGTTGYGEGGAPGVGRYPSWQQYLAATVEHAMAVGEEEPERAFAVDGPLRLRAAEEVLRLAPACPEQRWLLHGDYGYDNVLTDGQRITGVIDWANAGYGDYLCDVSWLGFWPVGRDTTDELRQRYGSAAEAANYDERITCYQCLIGLGALGFFARAGREQAYGWVQERLRGILAALPET